MKRQTSSQSTIKERESHFNISLEVNQMIYSQLKGKIINRGTLRHITNISLNPNKNLE